MNIFSCNSLASNLRYHQVITSPLKRLLRQLPPQKKDRLKHCTIIYNNISGDNV